MIYPRDEAKQARLLAEQIDLLDEIGVDGAYIMSFSFPLSPHDPDPRHDLDATALALVRTLPSGQHGTAYPEMAWEPKEAFHAVVERYRRIARRMIPGPIPERQAQWFPYPGARGRRRTCMRSYARFVTSCCGSWKRWTRPICAGR
jgi:hypothetical protein